MVRGKKKIQNDRKNAPSLVSWRLLFYRMPQRNYSIRTYQILQNPLRYVVSVVQVVEVLGSSWWITKLDAAITVTLSRDELENSEMHSTHSFIAEVLQQPTFSNNQHSPTKQTTGKVRVRLVWVLYVGSLFASHSSYAWKLLKEHVCWKSSKPWNAHKQPQRQTILNKSCSPSPRSYVKTWQCKSKVVTMLFVDCGGRIMQI